MIIVSLWKCLLAGRLLIAVLLKHHGLGRVVVNLISSDREVSTVTVPAPPRCLVEVCKTVHQARTALIKVLSAQIFVILTKICLKKVKATTCVALHGKPISELRGVACHMGSHSVTCHPTQVNAPRHNPSQTGRYSIYLPWRDGRLSWPR